MIHKTIKCPLCQNAWTESSDQKLLSTRTCPKCKAKITIKAVRGDNVYVQVNIVANKQDVIELEELCE